MQARLQTVNSGTSRIPVSARLLHLNARHLHSVRFKVYVSVIRCDKNEIIFETLFAEKKTLASTGCTYTTLLRGVSVGFGNEKKKKRKTRKTYTRHLNKTKIDRHTRTIRLIKRSSHPFNEQRE